MNSKTFHLTPYFQKNYSEIALPQAPPETVGLRRPQLGAIHAIASHFTLRSDPAIAVLPTGSGKTAVLMMTGFFLRAERVLVITPSRLVRGQIADNFKSLSILKKLNVLGTDVEPPQVIEISGRVGTIENWRALEKYDVIIGTPNSLSPKIEGNSEPPEALFDLVLVDEAHHSPASSWAAIFKAFPKARKILFTATPFRKDQKEIKGQFVYVYPLREAVRDEIFGKLEFIAVSGTSGTSNDALIARKAEQVFNQDKKAGFQHALMVRTDSKEKSEKLVKVYKKETKLKLKVVHSGHSPKYIKQTIKHLCDQKLDGVICVAMLGEGFDFPNLKIAAIHTPHRSLEVTLQFIGRFARTGGDKIGTAKFIAVPAEIEIESEKLYTHEAVWQEIIANLNETKISKEEKIREAFQTFDKPNISSIDTEDISLYSLKPYNHVKIYRVEDDGQVDLTREIEFPKNYEIVYQNYSAKYNTTVFITREALKPRWTHLETFFRTEFDLFVVYFDRSSKLLFINSSRRDEAIYKLLAALYTKMGFSRLPLSRINRVLLGLKNTDFFSIGMKNRIPNSNTESYRIITGPSTQNAIDSAAGRLYHQGHIFGKADSEQGPVTIGYSSASKVWSNRNTQIPELVEWCQEIAKKLTSEKKVITNSPLDLLGVGLEVTQLPSGVIAVDWHQDAYKDHPRIVHQQKQGVPVETQLLDLDVSPDLAASNQKYLRFKISNNDFEWNGQFSYETDTYFTAPAKGQPSIKIIHGDSEIPLLEYLNTWPLYFYFADFSVLQEAQLYKYNDNLQPFPLDQITCFDWNKENVDPEVEFHNPGKPKGSKKSIHDFLKETLVQDSCQIVIYDHGSGEIADFVTVQESAHEIVFTLYHCKGAGGKASGDRVNDVYEVCQQVVKSIIWHHSIPQFQDKLQSRLKANSTVVKGTDVVLNGIFQRAPTKQVRFITGLVQPGISKSKLTEKIATVLAGADQFIRNNKGERVFVWASA